MIVNFDISIKMMRKAKYVNDLKSGIELQVLLLKEFLAES